MTDDRHAAADLRIVIEDVPDSHVVEALLPAFHEDNQDVAVEVDIMHYDFMLDRILPAINDPDAPNGVVIFDSPAAT
jgi:hypothetical protein